MENTKTEELVKLLEEDGGEYLMVRPAERHQFKPVTFRFHTVMELEPGLYVDDVRHLDPNQKGTPTKVLLVE